MSFTMEKLSFMLHHNNKDVDIKVWNFSGILFTFPIKICNFVVRYVFPESGNISCGAGI